MNTKLLAFLLLVLAMSFPALAAAETKENTEKNTEKVVEEVDTEASEALASGIGWQLIRTAQLGNTDKTVYMVLIEQGRQADKTIYSSSISRLCRDEKEFCRVRFWQQEHFIPTEGISMSTLQYQHLLADHLFNREGGINQIQYACSVDPLDPECVAHKILPGG